MEILPTAIRSLTRLGLLAVVVSSCAAAADLPTPTATFTTLMPGWESKFSLDWQVQPGKDATTVVYGRIANRYGQFAEPVRLLGQALDSSENVVGQRIAWVQGGVPGFSRVYFEIDRLAVADHYRVTVWTYTLIEARGALP